MLKKYLRGNPRRTAFCICGLAIFIFACVASQSAKIDPNLLPPGFNLEKNRSDLNRPARIGDIPYRGPIADTHVHLDPPAGAGINKRLLQEMLEKMERAGVVAMVVMPVPNEGHMDKYGSSGDEQRKMLRRMAGDKVKVFSGGEYISNWLNDAHYQGYNENELGRVLSRLNKDLNDPECAGIGEIGLYHFNKDSHQNIIEYPPTFEPFMTMVGMVAQKGAWLDLHAEPIDPYGKSYEAQVFGGLELLFQKFPNLKLIYSHTRMTQSKNARQILKRYPNIMMNFKPILKHDLWRNLEPITNPNGQLYGDWAELFEEMPERFMVGTDEKFGRTGKIGKESVGGKQEDYEKEIVRIRKLLGSLKRDVVELIAHRNAERIFK